MTRVDAHHHLWDPARRDYPFMAGDALAPLRRARTVADLAPLADACGITATVAVQAAHDERETRELLATAADHPLIAGVVGWTDLTAPDVAGAIAALRAAPGGRALVGIRHQAEDEPDPRWLVRDDVRRGIAAVAAAGLAYDVLVRPAQLPAAIELATALPEADLVLDHLGKPPIAAGEWRPWADLLAELAGHPNVTAKLSGLVTEADWTRVHAADLRRYTEHALAHFGADRVMFGSDWPVCTLAARYPTVVALAGELCDGLSETERRGVEGDTAARVYRIDR